MHQLDLFYIFYALFLVLEIISVRVKCFNNFVRFILAFFVNLILIYAFIVLVLLLSVKWISMLIMDSAASL